MSLEAGKKSKEIGGLIYEVTPLPSDVGTVALVRLTKIIAPIIGAANKSKVSGDSLASVLDTLALVLDDKDVTYFTDLFGAYSEFTDGGKSTKLVKLVRNEHFSGKYFEMFQWLAFCIEVNFQNFINGLLAGKLSLG